MSKDMVMDVVSPVRTTSSLVNDTDECPRSLRVSARDEGAAPPSSWVRSIGLQALCLPLSLPLLGGRDCLVERFAGMAGESRSCIGGLSASAMLSVRLGNAGFYTAIHGLHEAEDLCKATKR